MDGDSDAVTLQGSADQYTKFEKDLSYCFEIGAIEDFEISE